MTDSLPKADATDFSLVEAENSFLTRENDLTIFRPGLWPSEASVQYEDEYGVVTIGKCLRAAFYRTLDFPKDGPDDPGLSMKAELGKRAEAGCQERWKQMGMWEASNVKFYHHDLIVSGELDSVIKYEPVGFSKARIGIEIKSFYGHYANQEICGMKRPPTPGKPKIDQFLQALVYKEKYQDKLDQYRLYYLERGDGHRVEFEVGLTDSQPWWRQIPGPYWSTFNAAPVETPFMLEDMHSRYKTLIRHVRERVLPPKDYTNKYTREQVEIQRQRGKIGKTKYDKWVKNPDSVRLGDWNCDYCKFANRCRNDDIEEARNDGQD